MRGSLAPKFKCASPTVAILLINMRKESSHILIMNTEIINGLRKTITFLAGIPLGVISITAQISKNLTELSSSHPIQILELSPIIEVSRHNLVTEITATPTAFLGYNTVECGSSSFFSFVSSN